MLTKSGGKTIKARSSLLDGIGSRLAVNLGDSHLRIGGSPGPCTTHNPIGYAIPEATSINLQYMWGGVSKSNPKPTPM